VADDWFDIVDEDGWFDIDWAFDIRDGNIRQGAYTGDYNPVHDAVVKDFEMELELSLMLPPDNTVPLEEGWDDDEEDEDWEDEDWEDEEE
jgi:hypothetical protein